MGELMARNLAVNPRFAEPYWPGTCWYKCFDFTIPQETEDRVELDERVTYFYEAVTSSDGMVNPVVGAGQVYMTTKRDSEGRMLRADRTYRLRVPKDVPAKQFWSLTLYSESTRRPCDNGGTEIRSTSLDSNTKGMKRSDDGSIDPRPAPVWPPGVRASTALGRGAAFFGLWLLLMQSAHPADVAVGLLAAAGATWLSLRLLPPAHGRLRPGRLLALLPHFVWQSVLAGIDVARRALGLRGRPMSVRAGAALPLHRATAAAGALIERADGLLRRWPTAALALLMLVAVFFGICSGKAPRSRRGNSRARPSTAAAPKASFASDGRRVALAKRASGA